MLRHLKSALVICLLASCTSMDNEQASAPSPGAEDSTPVSTSASSPPTSTLPRPAVDASAELATSASGLALSRDGENSRREPTVYKGSNQLVRMPPEQSPVRLIGEDVSLNFEQAPLSEVMHAILGDILNLDYIVDRP